MLVPELSGESKQGLSLAWAGYIAVLSIWTVLQKRRPASTISWILSLALTKFAGFAIYYFLGPQRLRKQRLRRLRNQAGATAQADFARLRDVAKAAPPELRQMAQLGVATCGLPVSSATRVDLLSGGARTADSIFEAVRAVRHHVHLEYCIHVWKYKLRMLHSKTLLVDDDCAVVGTANFDNRSFRLNF